jgi:hypothetical protein
MYFQIVTTNPFPTQNASLTPEAPLHSFALPYQETTNLTSVPLD